MITSQVRHAIPQFDEWVVPEDPDFEETGLKVASTIRIARLAVAHEQVIMGRLGGVSEARLQSMRGHLAQWLGGLLPTS